MFWVEEGRRLEYLKIWDLERESVKMAIIQTKHDVREEMFSGACTLTLQTPTHTNIAAACGVGVGCT